MTRPHLAHPGPSRFRQIAPVGGISPPGRSRFGRRQAELEWAQGVAGRITTKGWSGGVGRNGPSSVELSPIWGNCWSVCPRGTTIYAAKRRSVQVGGHSRLPRTRWWPGRCKGAPVCSSAHPLALQSLEHTSRLVWGRCLVVVVSSMSSMSPISEGLPTGRCRGIRSRAKNSSAFVSTRRTRRFTPRWWLSPVPDSGGANRRHGSVR